MDMETKTIFIVRGVHKSGLEIAPRATNSSVNALKICRAIASAHGERLHAERNLDCPACDSIKFTIEEMRYYETV